MQVGNIICHIDTSNQIHNSWYRDTVVGIYAEGNSLLCTVKINKEIKLKIKDKLKDYQEPQIIAHLHAYLVYMILTNKEDYFLRNYIKVTKLCRDVQPIKNYMNALGKCFSLHGKQELLLLARIKPKKADEKSKAHPKVSKVYKNKKRATIYFNKEHMNSFLNYFNKLSCKKKEERSSGAPKPH